MYKHVWKAWRTEHEGCRALCIIVLRNERINHPTITTFSIYWLVWKSITGE
jgi:hypothetical protein